MAPVTFESCVWRPPQDFISLICDIQMMEASMREIGFDPNKARPAQAATALHLVPCAPARMRR